MCTRVGADGAYMKMLGAALVSLAMLVPVGHAVAAPDVISQPLGALQGASRIGNATQTGAPVQPPPVPTAPSVGVISTEMQQVLDLVNVERTSRGLGPVSFSAQLNVAALAHTQRQADAGALFHVDPLDGSDPGDRISRTGYVFGTWGENISAGYRTPAAAMQAWMSSSGHCQNILNPAFTELGVGHVTGGARYDHFWTQVFARPSGVAQPAGTFNPAWC